MSETIIDLFRHGEPEGGKKYRGYSVDDPLSEKGWSQMWDAIEGCKDWDCIVTSPMLRCREFSEKLSQKLDLPFYSIATQTYPRKQEVEILNALANLGGTIYKFAFDLRILQSPPFGEWSEPFREKQVGSSAMPFKRNPINSEKLNSLGRYLAQLRSVLNRRYLIGSEE